MFMPHYRSPQTGEWPCPMWLETTRKVTKSPPLKAHSWGSGHKDYNLPVPTKNEFLSLFYSIVTVRMDPPKLVPPGTNFLINKDPLELILLKNLDPLWKIWTTRNLFYWIIWTPSEKFGPPSRGSLEPLQHSSQTLKPLEQNLVV